MWGLGYASANFIGSIFTCFIGHSHISHIHALFSKMLSYYVYEAVDICTHNFEIQATSQMLKPVVVTFSTESLVSTTCDSLDANAHIDLCTIRSFRILTHWSQLFGALCFAHSYHSSFRLIAQFDDSMFVSPIVVQKGLFINFSINKAILCSPCELYTFQKVFNSDVLVLYVTIALYHYV